MYKSLHGISFNASNIHIITTNYQRTFQSAQALIFSLVSRDQFQLINVSVVPDVYFCGTQKRTSACQNCGLAKSLLSRVNRQTSQRVRQHPFYNTVMDDLRNIFGFNTKRLPWLSAITEAVMTFACHDKPLPCHYKSLKSIKPRCVTPSLLNQMHIVLEEGVSYVRSSYNFQKLQRLLAYPLLTMIGTKLKTDIRNHQMHAAGFHLYSAHDMTLTALITSLLGHDRVQHVPSASRLIIELYADSHDDKEDKHYWRILFNGIDYTHTSLPCAGRNLYKRLCHFKYLRQYLEQDRYFSLFNRNDTTYNALCNN